MGDASAWAAAGRTEESLWLLEKFVPGSGVNNVAFAFRVDGRLDRDRLAAALRLVVAANDALRTRFRAEDSRLVKAVIPDNDVEVEELLDLSEFASRVFPLDGGPLLRAGLSPDGELVCVVAHHLIFDALSAFLLGEALATAYDSSTVGVHSAPSSVAASGEFWEQHLDGFDPAGLALNIPTRETTDWKLAGSEITYSLRPELSNVIKRLRKDLRAPDAVVLLAAYYVLLASHGAGPDLVVGCPFTTRDESSARAIGFHVNVLPLRAAVDRTTTFRDLTRAVRTVFLAAMDNTTADVGSVLPQVQRSQSWRNPIFRHVFNYVPIGSDLTFQIGGLEASTVHLEARYSKFDLEFFLLAAPDRLRLRAVYSTEVHSAGDVEALLRRYEAILLALDADVDRPIGEIPLWSDLDWSSPEPDVSPVVPAARASADDELVAQFIVLWQQILTRDDVDADSNFFTLGGQSLLAALLTQRAEEIAGVPIALAEFFTHPTPAALAGHARAQGA